MTRTLAVSLALLVASALGCKRDYPYQPAAARLARSHATCRVVANASWDDRRDCRDAAAWLAMQGRHGEARALERSLCLVGDLESCGAVLRFSLDAAAAVPLCFEDPYVDAKACDLAFTVVPPGDPRRVDLFTRMCNGSEATCELLLGLELAADPAAWQHAVGWCTGVPPDEATCEALRAETWSTPEFAAGLQRILVGHLGCFSASAMVCNAAAARFRTLDPTHLEARRDLFDRGCRMSNDEHCWRRTRESERLTQRGACAAGDDAACATIGKALVDDGSGGRFEAAFELTAPPKAAAPPAPAPAP